MKNLLIAFSLCLLISCGTDDIVNNNGNPPPANETLVFSMSEFKLESDSQFVTKDTLINFVIANTDSLKATFTLETNCDTTESPYAEFGLNWSPYSWQYNSMASLNSTHTEYAVANDTFFVALFAGMYRPNAVRYVKFKNISVYKIHN